MISNLITPTMLEHEAKRAALYLKLCNHLDYNVIGDYDPASGLTFLTAKNEENKSVTISFTDKELSQSLEDLDPKIFKALKQLYSRDLAFILLDYT